MQNIQEQFRKSYRLWTEREKQEVEQFFMTNRFLSKIYQFKKFDQFVRICLYRKLQPGQRLALQNNNRAEAIILLSGHVTVRKKEWTMEKKAKVIKQQIQQKKQKKLQIKLSQRQIEYIFLGHLKDFNQTLTLNSECIVQAPQERTAEIIFVPCYLFNKLQEQIETERIQKIERVLQKFFFRLNKKQLHQLSHANCIFKEFKMNNYIYRASSKPEELFILLDGIVKLEKPGFSQQKLKETILINPGMHFGENDLKMEYRQRNAVACTAFVEVLTIPKNAFLKFASKAFPDMVFEDKTLPSNNLEKVDDVPKTTRNEKASPQRSNSLLPSIHKQSRFHQNSLHMERKRSLNEQKREYELIKNSHRLLDLNQRTKKKIQLRSFFPKYKEQVQLLIERQKIKMKHINHLNKFSFEN